MIPKNNIESVSFLSKKNKSKYIDLLKEWILKVTDDLISIDNFVDSSEKTKYEGLLNMLEISEKDFVEVYIESTISTCEKRDVKGLYKKARAGKINEFTGISSPFEPPQNPDIQVKTEEQTPEESIDYLFEQLKSKL